LSRKQFSYAPAACLQRAPFDLVIAPPGDAADPRNGGGDDPRCGSRTFGYDALEPKASVSSRKTGAPFSKALIQQISSGRHQRLADAVLAAQEDLAQTGAFPELLSICNLLGDPALRVR